MLKLNPVVKLLGLTILLLASNGISKPATTKASQAWCSKAFYKNGDINPILGAIWNNMGNSTSYLVLSSAARYGNGLSSLEWKKGTDYRTIETFLDFYYTERYQSHAELLGLDTSPIEYSQELKAYYILAWGGFSGEYMYRAETYIIKDNGKSVYTCGGAGNYFLKRRPAKVP